MVLRFPKTANQIDKLSDAELASLIFKGRHFKKIISGIINNIEKVRIAKVRLEANKHKLESKVEMLKLREREGRLTPKQRIYLEEFQKSIANIDTMLEEIELKIEAHLKHMEESVRLFRLNIERLESIVKEEITFTDRERKVLKRAAKASLPLKS